MPQSALDKFIFELPGFRESEVDRLYTDEVIARIAYEITEEVGRPFIGQQAELEFPKVIRDWAKAYLFFRGWFANEDSWRTTSKELMTLARHADQLVKAIDGLDSHAVRLLTYQAIRVVEQKDSSVPDGVAILAPLEEKRAWERLAETKQLCRMLNTLAKASVDTVTPKRGRKPDRARRVAVQYLGGIYTQSTGRAPTRIISSDGDRAGKPDGDFYWFCVEAFAPIHRDQAETGLDNIIRDLYG